MTGQPDARRRLAARAVLAAGVAVAAVALWNGGIDAAGPPTSWRQYQAAARVLVPAAEAGPVDVPASSVLRSTDVRFPDGSAVRVDPHLLVSGLAGSPTSTMGRAARAALAALVTAPASPGPVPQAARAERRLALILRQHAFAPARQGALAQAWRWLRTAFGALLGKLAGHLAVPVSVTRMLLVIAGAGALAAAGLAAVRLLRAGSDRVTLAQRGGPRRLSAPAMHAPSAEERLRDGDLRTAVRLIYAEAVRGVASRRGLAIRPGWTAHDIRRAAGLDADWPGFAGLAALHERVLFGPPPPASALPALLEAAEAWQGEVRRWSRGAPG